MLEMDDGVVQLVSRRVSEALIEQYGKRCGSIVILFNKETTAVTVYGPPLRTMGALVTAVKELSVREPEATRAVMEQNVREMSPDAFAAGILDAIKVRKGE